MGRKVSGLAIVIPYYKLTFFRETLKSLAEQTNQNFTVYIGNDTSPENPEELLKDFEGKFDFIYKKFEKNLGSVSLSKHWNRCIAMMQDEKWFMILGDDDYLSNNTVAEFFENRNILEEEKLSVIKLNSAIVNEENVIKKEKKSEPKLKSSIEHFFDKYRHEGRSSLSEHIFRKTKYDQFGFVEMPFAWHSDDLALLEFSGYGNILFLEKAKVFVRVSSESISGNPDQNKSEKWKASKIFFDKICQNLSKFTKQEKKKLFEIIEWQETSKNIEIDIPDKLFEFYKCFGLKKAVKLLIIK